MRKIEHRLVTDFFDVHKTKSDEYGKLHFWNTNNGILSKEFSPNNKSLITNIIIIDNLVEDNLLDKMKIIISTENGEIGMLDYETGELIKRFSPPVEKLQPFTLEYRNFHTTMFIAVYTNGYIKLFKGVNHKNIAFGKGELMSPNYIEFSGPKIILVADLVNWECEIWDLQTFTRKNDAKLAFPRKSYPKLNPKNTKLYTCELKYQDEENIQYIVNSYSLEKEDIFKLENSFELNEYELILTNFFITPNDKYFLFFRQNDILIYDLRTKKTLFTNLKGIKNVKYINDINLFLDPSSIDMIFIVILENTYLYLTFYEDTCEFSGLEDTKDINIPMHSEIYHFDRNNKWYIGFIDTQIPLREENYIFAPTGHFDSLEVDSKRKYHIIYELDMDSGELVKVEELYEPIHRDKMLGYLYFMEKSFSYDLKTNKALYLLRNTYMEDFSYEYNIKIKKVNESSHKENTFLYIQGCTFPALDIRFNKSQEKAINLFIKHDAFFDRSQNLLFIAQDYFNEKGIIGILLALIFILPIQIIIGIISLLYNIPRLIKKWTRKKIYQKDWTPYHTKPIIVDNINNLKGKGFYYESILYENEIKED